MLHRLSSLASQLLVDREAVLRTVAWPVLVWEAAPAALLSGAAGARTVPGGRPQKASSEPLVFELRPRLPRGGSDVLVGRDIGCDVVLAEPTVSRTHARFRQEPHTGGWTVTDLASHNGTFEEGVLIVPGRPVPLFRRASLRLGGVQLLFLLADAFEQYVRARALPSPVRLTRGG